jgi:hypothetical protein
MAKYDRLSEWLAEQHGAYIECTFAGLYELVGSLPPSARAHRAWWANDRSHVQARAWLDAGFHVEKVNITAEQVSFRRGS